MATTDFNEQSSTNLKSIEGEGVKENNAAGAQQMRFSTIQNILKNKALGMNEGLPIQRRGLESFFSYREKKQPGTIEYDRLSKKIEFEISLNAEELTMDIMGVAIGGGDGSDKNIVVISENGSILRWDLGVDRITMKNFRSLGVESIVQKKQEAANGSSKEKQKDQEWESAEESVSSIRLKNSLTKNRKKMEYQRVVTQKKTTRYLCSISSACVDVLKPSSFGLDELRFSSVSLVQSIIESSKTEMGEAVFSQISRSGVPIKYVDPKKFQEEIVGACVLSNDSEFVAAISQSQKIGVYNTSDSSKLNSSNLVYLIDKVDAPNYSTPRNFAVDLQRDHESLFRKGLVPSYNILDEKAKVLCFGYLGLTSDGMATFYTYNNKKRRKNVNMNTNINTNTSGNSSGNCGDGGVGSSFKSNTSEFGIGDSSSEDVNEDANENLRLVLLIGLTCGELVIWDVKKRKVLCRYVDEYGAGAVTTISTVQNTSFIVTGHACGSITAIEGKIVENEMILEYFGSGRIVNSAVSLVEIYENRNGIFIFSGYHDGTVYLQNLNLHTNRLSIDGLCILSVGKELNMNSKFVDYVSNTAFTNHYSEMDPVFGTLDSDYFNHSLSNQCTSEVCVCDVENPEFSFELEEFSDNCDPEESCTFIWPPFAEHNTDEDEGEQLNDFKATDIQYKNKVCSDYPHTGKIQSIKVWSPFGSDGYGIDSFKGLKRVRYDEDVIFVASSSAEDYSVRIFCLNTSHIAEPKPTCSNSISVDKITFLAFIKQTGSTHIELDSNKGLLMGVRRKNDTKNGVDSFRPELSRSKNKYKHNHKSNRPKLNSNTTGDDGVSPNERTTGSSSRKDASYWTPLLRLSVSDVRYWFYALFKLLYRTIFNIIKSLIVYQKIESYLKKQPKFKFIEAIYNIIRGWGFLDRGDTDIYFQATNNSDIFGELGHLGLSNDFELSSSKGDSSSRSKNSKAGGAQNGSLGSNSAVGYRSTSQFSWELWTFDLFVLFGNTLYTKPEYQNIDSLTNKCSQALTGDKQGNTNANTNSDRNGNGNVGTDATSNSNSNDSSNNNGNNNNGNALLPSTFYPLISPSISSFIPSYLQKINILSMNLPLNLSIQLPSYYKYQSKTDPLTQYSPPNTVVYSASDICIDFNPAPLFDSLPLQLQLHSASSPLVEPTTHADDISSHSSFDPLSDHPSVNSMATNMNPAASNNLGASLRDSLFNRFHFDTNTPFVVIKSIKLVQSGTPRDYSRYVDSISNFNNIVNTSANANATTPLNTSTSVNNSNLVNTDNVSNVSGISGRNHTSNLYRGYNSDASQKSTTHGPKNPIDTDSKSAGLTHSFSYTVLAVASGNTIKLISV